MQNIKLTFWALLALLTALWLLAEPTVFQPANFFALRGTMVQYTGIIAMAAMSVAMILALRPRWPERWFGGLDKMYRLHKWLGIAALVVSVVHWLWGQGPKWAVGWGLIERPVRGERPPLENPIEQLLMSQRGTAEGLGEWAFYAAVLLIVLALLKYFPYQLFYKTHRLLAAAYLVLVFHAVVLTTFSYWMSPIGTVMALLLAAGTYSAVIVLLRRVGAGRQVRGRIASLQYYPGVKALETEIEVPQGWPGHKPGQFAFAMSDRTEGAHPYTIASAWNEKDRRITFVTKELGDHTSRLREKLKVGDEVSIEGPYGCFDFDNGQPRQIWIGGGIGITPFIAGMKHLAQERRMHPDQRPPMVDLFHTTADYDEKAIVKLTEDAVAAGIRLHVLVDARDGLLTGERIRVAVPDWRDASIWFCGPTGFGEALRRDFSAQGLPVAKRFHHELFAMR
ncbi:MULTISPECIES: ferredoxin reductase family protein [Paracoccus]|uniref:Ferric reductase-like transmembrane domain-containing protein n=3 Tax=Paracoccus TaxID=265 RepID=A0A7H9BV31_PARPN|nr:MULTISPECIES: ferric reductase-like transmembrane domain-containing protein [Paracoccus]MDF3856107.1 ferric reductase-like transmembrane domain-containing protein [Paracoccus pantotrophus]MDQ7263675.1 ferric reductase-like transmembrane domain-containing protein [Paracoccus sp. PS1]QLH15207.1 ferric reductase-like transmembrane domain-containing protein [Paracoccus pantotrophus]SFP00075.1 Predicted ferric reductase [Paracoccus pantotrophus]